MLFANIVALYFNSLTRSRFLVGEMLLGFRHNHV